MRTFNNVLVRSACIVCGTIVEPSPETGYSRQTVVRFDGSDLGFTYCSNRCVNADSDRASEQAENASHYWAHVEADMINRTIVTDETILDVAYALNADYDAIQVGLDDLLARLNAPTPSWFDHVLPASTRTQDPSHRIVRVAFYQNRWQCVCKCGVNADSVMFVPDNDLDMYACDSDSCGYCGAIGNEICSPSCASRFDDYELSS